MKILLLGSGGREHAFAWKISKSSQVEKLFIAPGNAGTESVGVNLAIAENDFEGLKQFALAEKIDMVVVGPEKPLVEGVVDFFSNDEELRHIPVIGPDKQGAMLEGSKQFSKNFMMKHGIPTARYLSVDATNLQEGLAFLRELKAPYVLKADGLAAGKGVLILSEIEEAEKELREMLQGKFGDASSTVVIEEYLSGIECSVFVMTDGKNYKILPVAKDYKRIGEKDTGLNTGGMGAVSPVPFADEVFMQKVEERIIKPTINGLQKDNINYKGFIFIGLMNVEGDPFVIEYNARMGDPETEAVMLRIKSDLVDLLKGVAGGNLNEKILEIDSRSAVTIVLASGGYPESFEKGKEIFGLNMEQENTVIFHAGTKKEGEKILTNGGRVLAISSLGKTKHDARLASLVMAEKISFDKKYYRTDIGLDV
ncbi:MAG: phosphoribosylamine--glycine ligase [Paludibacteraceae bacterium]|nr:phosphoribosylamine--glycine ligase [Paludibacteraceae bacterium]